MADSATSSAGITEEMIEAAARASFYRVHAEPYAAVKFEDLPPEFHEGWLASARVGLEAALAGRTVLDEGEYAMRDFGLDVDYEAGGVYVSLNHNPVARTEAWGDDVNVDYDKDGTPTGVEILRPRRLAAVSSKGGDPKPH